MRLTYTNLKEQHFRNIGKSGEFTNTTLLADFNYALGVRYQMVMGTLSNYLNQDTQVASTVAAQQYYYYPVATVGVDSATIIIGSVQFTLTPIYSQQSWNMLNALQIQPTAIPQFIFPRRDDFGIWPIPQAVYTISFNRYARDRNMLVDDYVTGTVSLTNGSVTVTGTDTVFTEAMIGRWFTVTDTAQRGQGYWYRIADYNSATSIELETFWNGPTTSSAVTYRIGESPEMPEEGHAILASGTTADYYAGLRNDSKTATWFNNVFWTGDGQNSTHDLDSTKAPGGLIAILRKYKDRERDNVVIRRPPILNPASNLFAQTIT